MCSAKKGSIPWNKGLTKETNESVKKISESNKGKGHPQDEETNKKISTSLTGIKRGPQTDDHKQKNREAHLGNPSPNKGKFGENHPTWKGGYGNIPLYETYAAQLEPIEQCRRNEQDPNILEVRCTYCGVWFIPTTACARGRVRGIDNNDRSRLYCSDKCKKECPIYRQIKNYRGQKNSGPREVQPELRQLVFARDNYTCQKCGELGGSLHCHHIDPVKNNPIESADVDNCITLCKECHKWVHKNIKGCGYGNLAKCK